MISKREYIEYLISTPANYTASNLADHLVGVSHDAVSDYLQRSKPTARHLWELVHPLLADSEDACLIVDDSGQNKAYSRKIAWVKRQYSGAEHGLVRGIGVVNLVHTDGTAAYPIDYRIYAPLSAGKTKNDHFQDMLIAAKADKRLRAKRILFDSWYAALENLKLIVRLQMVFITTLKDNRLVSRTKEDGYLHLQDIGWSADELAHGITIKLKDMPFKVQLFKLVATNGDIDWVITNADRPEHELERALVQNENKLRWQIEQLHRELKQLTGSEKCQSRAARSQRTHLACCYSAWLALKVKAKELGKTLYAVQADLLHDYLRAELRNPRIPAYGYQ